MLSEEDFKKLKDQIAVNFALPDAEYTKEDLQEIFKDCSPKQIKDLLSIKIDDQTILDDLPEQDISNLLGELGLTSAEKLPLLEGRADCTDLIAAIKTQADNFKKLCNDFLEGEGHDSNKDILKDLPLPDKMALLRVKNRNNKTILDCGKPEELLNTLTTEPLLITEPKLQYEAMLNMTVIPQKDMQKLLKDASLENRVEMLMQKDQQGNTLLNKIAKPEEAIALMNEIGLNNEQKLEVLLAINSEIKSTPEINALIEQVLKNQEIENFAIKQKVADLGVQDQEYGLSQLHKANGNTEDIKKLLADVSAPDQVKLLKIKDKSGKTPLDYVKHY